MPRAVQLLTACPCCLRPWTKAEQENATRGVLQLEDDGTWRVAGPLAATLAPNRARLVMAMLEARAILQHDVRAAAVLLEHQRWRAEMRKGKAPSRVDVQHNHRVTVVNNLGLPREKQLPAAIEAEIIR